MTKQLRYKIIAATLSFFAVVAVTVTFCVLGAGFSDDGAYGETFAGSVSARAYFDKDSAARAFVENELGGATASPMYVGYRKTGELDAEEVAKLNGLGLTDDTILGGEKNEVDFVSNEQEATARTYLLDTDGGCRYYVPLPQAGEPVTNAYLSTVLDGDSYLNCTSMTTVHVRMLDIDNTYRQVIRFADDKAFFKQELPGLINDVYLGETAGGIEVYIEHPQKSDGKFYSLTEINRDLYRQGLEYELNLIKGGETVSIDSLNGMKDVTDFAFMINADASFFVKTAKGFSMPNDKYVAVCKSMMGEDVFENFDAFRREHKVHFRSDYTVSGGKLSKSETVLNMVYDDEIIVIAVKSSYSAFGTTEVVIPDREVSE